MTVTRPLGDQVLDDAAAGRTRPGPAPSAGARGRSARGRRASSSSRRASPRRAPSGARARRAASRRRGGGRGRPVDSVVGRAAPGPRRRGRSPSAAAVGRRGCGLDVRFAPRPAACVQRLDHVGTGYELASGGSPRPGVEAQLLEEGPGGAVQHGLARSGVVADLAHQAPLHAACASRRRRRRHGWRSPGPGRWAACRRRWPASRARPATAGPTGRRARSARRRRPGRGGSGSGSRRPPGPAGSPGARPRSGRTGSAQRRSTSLTGISSSWASSWGLDRLVGHHDQRLDGPVDLVERHTGGQRCRARLVHGSALVLAGSARGSARGGGVSRRRRRRRAGRRSAGRRRRPPT